MKLLFRTFTSYEDLPKANLPLNAVCFEEGDSIEEVISQAMRYNYPLIFFILLMMVIKVLFFAPLGLSVAGFILGSFISLPFLLIHELIHALLLPKNEPIYVYQALKKGVLFVLSIEAMTKRRFIVMSLMPMVLLGFLPLFYWLFSNESLLSSSLFFFSVPMILGGVGDLYNVSNTFKQVPKGAFVQLSGFHSYWFLNQT